MIDNPAAIAAKALDHIIQTYERDLSRLSQRPKGQQAIRRAALEAVIDVLELQGVVSEVEAKLEPAEYMLNERHKS